MKEREESAKDRFDKKLLIQQNSCLANKLREVREELTLAQKQIKQLKESIEEKDKEGSKKEGEREEALQVLISELRQQNSLLKQRITLLSSYRYSPMEQVIQKGEHLCYCGGLLIHYYQDKVQQILALQKQQTEALLNRPLLSSQGNIPELLMEEEGRTSMADSELLRQNQELKWQLSKAEKGLQECHLTHHYNLDYILQSPIYAQLKNSCKNLLLFCSTIIGKQSHMFSKFDNRDQERQLKVKALFDKLKAPFASIKPEDLVSKSPSKCHLDELKKMQTEMNAKIDDLSLKLRRFNRRYSQLGKQADSLNKIEPNSFEEVQVSIMCQMHTLISKWTRDAGFRQFLSHNEIRQKHAERMWIRYKNMVRVIFDDNLDLRRQVLCLHQRLMKEQVVEEVKGQFRDILHDIRKLQNSYQAVKRSILDAQYRATATVLQQNFKYQKESLRKQEMETRVNQLEKKMPLFSKVIEQSTNLTALIEQERLQNRQRQGQLTGRVGAFGTELAEKDRLIEIYKANHQKSLQDIFKLTKEVDRLKAIIQKTAVEGDTSKEEEHKELVQALYKKFTCLCERGRQISRALTTCGHTFCSECVDKHLLKGRKRECPICATKFMESQVARFKLN